MRTFRLFLCFVIGAWVLSAVLPIFAEHEIPKREEASITQKKIALTFDDGPHPRYTPQILDVLAEYGITATFFVIGENAALYPEPLRRCAREGHEIGNHTYTHPKMNRISSDDFRRELSACQAEIEKVTGILPRLFRPPAGFIQPLEENIPAEFSLSKVKWSIDTRDWAETDADEIVKTVQREAGDRKIILMHDYVSHKSRTVAALRRIIPYLLSEGYTFTTVSEL